MSQTIEQGFQQEQLDQAEVDALFAEIVEEIETAVPEDDQEKISTEPVCKPSGRSDQGWCDED